MVAVIRYYRRLSQAKYTVINEMERAFPVQPYTSEWELLHPDETLNTNALQPDSKTAWWKPRKHREATAVEQVVPLSLRNHLHRSWCKGGVRMNYLDVVAIRIRDQVPSNMLPEHDSTDLFRGYALLALTKGTAVSREDVHNAWVAWMLSRGEQHESMVPFAELDASTQNEDSPFVTAIRSVAADTA